MSLRCFPWPCHIEMLRYVNCGGPRVRLRAGRAEGQLGYVVQS